MKILSTELKFFSNNNNKYKQTFNKVNLKSILHDWAELLESEKQSHTFELDEFFAPKNSLHVQVAAENKKKSSKFKADVWMCLSAEPPSNANSCPWIVREGPRLISLITGRAVKALLRHLRCAGG